MQFLYYETCVSCQDVICGWRLKFWLAFALTWPSVAGSYTLCIWQLKLAYLCLTTFDADFSQTLLVVQGCTTRMYNSLWQGCTLVFNTPRQDLLCIVHVCIHAMNRTRRHRFRFWPQNLDLIRPRVVCLGTALHELYHSNLAFSEFSQLLSIDSPVESTRQKM